MSMNQMGHFLGGIPAGTPKPQYYFMYEDHFTHEAFRTELLSKKVVTLGHLKDWTWHINCNRKSVVLMLRYC
jgi:hypothetical protein